MAVRCSVVHATWRQGDAVLVIVIGAAAILLAVFARRAPRSELTFPLWYPIIRFGILLAWFGGGCFRVCAWCRRIATWLIGPLAVFLLSACSLDSYHDCHEQDAVLYRAQATCPSWMETDAAVSVDVEIAEISRNDFSDCLVHWTVFYADTNGFDAEYDLDGDGNVEDVQAAGITYPDYFQIKIAAGYEPRQVALQHEFFHVLLFRLTGDWDLDHLDPRWEPVNT